MAFSSSKIMEEHEQILEKKILTLQLEGLYKNPPKAYMP
jgi:hypothetical protein